MTTFFDFYVIMKLQISKYPFKGGMIMKKSITLTLVLSIILTLVGCENKDSMTHFNVDDEVVVYYDGNIAESYPMQINVVYAITLKAPVSQIDDSKVNTGDGILAEPGEGEGEGEAGLPTPAL